MTNLKLLNVSLTKHGAHKLAILFKKYDSSQVLQHLWGSVDDVKIEVAQAKKNLSVRNEKVPVVWDNARDLGESAVNALVLIGIIFSHHKLISAMIESSDINVPMTGTIIRNKELEGKEFTNFAHTLEELGYSTEHSKNHVRYDLGSIFVIKGLHTLAVELLQMKLGTAGWKKNTSFADEAVSLDFHRVFTVSADALKNWLVNGVLASPTGTSTVADLTFFEEASDVPVVNPFVFKSGHNERKTGVVGVARPKKDATAELLHNAMQNKLFGILVKKYGPDSVGTEVPTGADTSIDVVVKTANKCIFYEIKTANTVKACIRQAIPQLLEYAYWHGGLDRADKLVIVGPVAGTPDANRYLALLKGNFNLPISYKQLEMP